ncbi:hypothetical protein SHIRM173S_07489 [Streptomyces hirsutus]
MTFHPGRARRTSADAECPEESGKGGAYSAFPVRRGSTRSPGAGPPPDVSATETSYPSRHSQAGDRFGGRRTVPPARERANTRAVFPAARCADTRIERPVGAPVPHASYAQVSTVR